MRVLMGENLLGKLEVIIFRKIIPLLAMGIKPIFL